MVMYKNNSCNRVVALCLGIVAFVWAATACADPSARVARLGYTSGAVSFSPAGDDAWVQATRNRPLITGDHLWVDAGARAELQVGSAAIQLDGNTSATLLNLDDSIAQLQLAQGSLNVRVRHLDPDDVFEIDTPNLAFSIREPGDYRIDVDADGGSTAVTVRNGRGEVYGEGSAYTIYARQSYRFFGTDLRDYDRYASLPLPDEFDRWSNDRNRRGENSMSARYVSRDVIGYEDLDEYGSWRSDPGYGHVWVPSHVSVGWAPYNDGHWVWVNPWGWTWVDDAPWGFTVSHYGRWAHIRGDWCWVPGPIAVRPVYAPALVAFVGGSNFQLSLSIGVGGGVAWFPLAPREVYRPAYPVSRDYFTKINTSNTVVNNVNITNVYNNTNVTNITYVNRQVPGAVVAVPTTAFVKSQSVAQSRVEVSKEAIRAAPVSVAATVTPDHESVRGAAAPGHKPPAVAMERAVIAKTAPPPKPVSFDAQQPALAANPGKPLDEATLATVKPPAPAPVAPVKLVGPSRSKDAGDKSQAGPSAPPQVQATPAPSPGRKGQSEPRKQRGQIAEPKTIVPSGTEKPAELAPVSPTVVEPDRKGQSEQRKQRGQAAEPKVIAPPNVEKPAEATQAPPAMIEPDRTPTVRPPVDREIKQVPSPQTGRPERRQSPNMVKPAEPASAPPPIVEPDRTPAARPPVDREIKQAPPPQTGRPERRQSPNMVKPAEPAPAPPAVIEPDRTPAARPPVDREIKKAPPPQTPSEQRGLAPKPENIKDGEQLKREEELRRREMQDNRLNQ